MEDQQLLAHRLQQQSLETDSWVVVSNSIAKEEPRSSSPYRARGKLTRLNTHPQQQSQSHAIKHLPQSANSLSQTSSHARPFDCSWVDCAKKFNRKSDLQRHFRIHTNERPYTCKVSGCGKSFIQRSALTVHHRTHSGEKPHVCEVETCLKRFSDSSSLARHRRIHTGKRPYKCPVPPCDKSFCRKTTLTKHTERSHREFSAQQPYANDFDEEDEDEDEDALEDDGMMRQNSASVAPLYNRNLWSAQSPAYQYIGVELNGPRASSRPPFNQVARSTELVGYPHPDLGMGQVEDLTVHQQGPHPSLASQMPVHTEPYFRSTGTLSHLDTTAMSRGYSSREAHSATSSSTTQSPEQFVSSADSFQSSPCSIEHEQLLQDVPRSCPDQSNLSHNPYANVPTNGQFQQSFGSQNGAVHYSQLNDLPLRNVQYGPQDITTQEVSMPLRIQIQMPSQGSVQYDPQQISPQQPMVLYHHSAMPSSSSLQPSPSQMQHQEPQSTPVEMNMATLEQQRHYEAERLREEQACRDDFMHREQQRQQEEALRAQQAAFENEQRQQREEQARLEEQEIALKTLHQARQLQIDHRQQQHVSSDEAQYAHQQLYQAEWGPEPCIEAVPEPAPYQPVFYGFQQQPSYGFAEDAWKEEYYDQTMPSQRIPDWNAPC